MRINEVFLSIEGECLHKGLPTIFVRATGCNLRCQYQKGVGCDTIYAYYEGKEMSIEEVLKEVQRVGRDYKLICLSGGEILLQPEVHTLIDRLIYKGYEVDIETNGSIPIDKIHRQARIILDIKCPYTEMHTKMYFSNLFKLSKRDEVKFVVSDIEDLEWSLEVLKAYPTKAQVVYSPNFGVLEPKKIVEFILDKKVNARVSLQDHKQIWDKNKRGV